MSVRIKELPQGDRPRERIIEQGPKSLSDYEVLAILLRTGRVAESAISLAQRLLKEKGGLSGLARLSARELAAMDGLGDAKAATLVAALELGRRMSQRKVEVKNAIHGAEDVFVLLGERLRIEAQEVFQVIYLNAKNQLIGAPKEISRGGLMSCPVDPSLIFREATIKNAVSVILIHNHPSGDPTPSKEDIRLTYRIVEAGDILGIEVLDHVIIGDGRMTSFKESGLLQ